MQIGAKFREMGAPPLPVRRLPHVRDRGALLRRCTVADGRAVYAEHHSVVGMSLDAVRCRRPGRRTWHGGDGLTSIVASRTSPRVGVNAKGSAALWLCVLGLLGVFAVGYPGYFVFDAIWPGYYYSPIAVATNAWLLGQALFMAVYLLGMVLAFGKHARALADLSGVKAGRLLRNRQRDRGDVEQRSISQGHVRIVRQRSGSS